MIMISSPAMLAVINLTIPLTFTASAILRCRRDLTARIDRVLQSAPSNCRLPRADLREEAAAVVRHVCGLCPARAQGRCAGLREAREAKVA